MIIVYSYLVISIVSGIISLRKISKNNIYILYWNTLKLLTKELNLKIPFYFLVPILLCISLPIIMPFVLINKISKSFDNQTEEIEYEEEQHEKTESPEKLGEYELDFVKVDVKTPDFFNRETAPSEVNQF